MTDEIPDWAIDRAVVLAGGVAGMSTDALHAFAHYIAEHEEPPVDPLSEEAIKLVRNFEAGLFDSNVPLALAALRRGMEIGKSS